MRVLLRREKPKNGRAARDPTRTGPDREGDPDSLSPRSPQPILYQRREMPFYRNALSRGLFSLMELAIVLVVLGLVATIVGPRMSRAAAAGPSPRLDHDVRTGRLRMLRAAVDEYAADHGGRFPEGDPDAVTLQ